jgi:S-adenosylmethionine decarboxylase
MEWLVDAQGCNSDALCDLVRMQGLCDRIVAELDLHVVGDPSWHSFPSPGGVTGLYLLTESHLSCHTYPEYGLAAFNLYCCRPRKPWDWNIQLREWIGATSVSVRTLERPPWSAKVPGGSA